MGKGSTFTLTIDAGLPSDAGMLSCPAGLAAAGIESLPNGSEPSLHGRLLLAEDDPSIQRIICLILPKMNLEVDVAVNGQVACQMAEQSKAEGRPYDLILMDIQMPDTNGYQATGRLRQRGWQGSIVALTAHAMVGDREKCLAAGCDDYLAKPVMVTGLREALARHLARPVDQVTS